MQCVWRYTVARRKRCPRIKS